MTDIVDFLRARLDEDEAAARGAMHPRLTEDDVDDWARIGARVHHFENGQREEYEAVSVSTGMDRWDRILVAADLDGQVAAHIARHDPARVLREVAAKRAILDEYVMADAAGKYPALVGGYANGLEEACQLLAAVYADHPDYDSTQKAASDDMHLS